MTFEKKSKSEIYYIHVNANCFFGRFSFATYVGDYLHGPTWKTQKMIPPNFGNPLLSMYSGNSGDKIRGVINPLSKQEICKK